MKKNKIVIIFFLIILFVMFLEIVLYLKEGLQLNELNNMYKDIELLEDSIDLYYLNNGELPFYEKEIINFEYSINPNDSDVFYEIDLNKLENLKLSYGNKKDSDDVYIVNEQSHSIYYYKGVEYNKEKYYTIKNSYSKIELELYQ